MPLQSVLSLVFFHVADVALVELDGFEMARQDVPRVC